MLELRVNEDSITVEFLETFAINVKGIAV